jgi:hypothetical protein
MVLSPPRYYPRWFSTSRITARPPFMGFGRTPSRRNALSLYLLFKVSENCRGRSPLSRRLSLPGVFCPTHSPPESEPRLRTPFSATLVSATNPHPASEQHKAVRPLTEHRRFNPKGLQSFGPHTGHYNLSDDMLSHIETGAGSPCHRKGDSCAIKHSGGRWQANRPFVGSAQMRRTSTHRSVLRSNGASRLSRRPQSSRSHRLKRVRDVVGSHHSTTSADGLKQA